MKKKFRVRQQRAARALLLRRYAFGFALALGAGLAMGADQEKDKEPAGFDGDPEAGNNWIELSTGAAFGSGSRAQMEQSRRGPRSVYGGIEDLHVQHEISKGTTFSLDGRGIYDAHDYHLGFGVRKEDAYFLRFNFANDRTYYNGNGGYFPPTDTQYQLSNKALALDRGEISFEGGWTPKDKPQITFKYSHLYRDGEKGSTIWGDTHPLLDATVRGLVPSFYDIDEKRDIFQLDARHRIKGTDVGLGFRYELGDLNNARKISEWPGEPALERKVTDRQGVTYDLVNVHAFAERWFKPNLLFSTGFLFSNLENNFSGNRIYGSDFDVSYAPNALNGQGFTALDGSSSQREYVLNLNLMTTPIKNLTIVPSIRAQREDWSSDSTAFSTLGNTTTGPFASNSDGDALDVRERLDVRYSGVTNWVFSAQGEWTEGQGNLNELGGIGLGAPIQRATEDSRLFQKYGLGVKWYPLRRASIDVGGYYKKNRYEYDHTLDNTPNNSLANRYPAYLVLHEFSTYDGNARLTLRPFNNLTLVSRYEFQLSTVDTSPDPASGLSAVESSKLTSHILAQNISWSPGSRLYLQAGFNYVWSETKSPASDYTQAILAAQNNYWTVNFNSGFVVDNKTDLNIGYTYYQARNYQDNSTVGLPLGVGAEEHGVSAAIVRRLSPKLRLTLRYGYYTAASETSGGHDDYQAHVVYSGLQYRF